MRHIQVRERRFVVMAAEAVLATSILAFSSDVFGVPPDITLLDATVLAGSPSSEAQRNPDETQHMDIISYAFYMGNYEVTQGEYQSLIGNDPSWFAPSNGYPGSLYLERPVESVTWAQATNYCYLLTQQSLADGSIKPGWAYRLPTEAEWEFSCRTTGGPPLPDQVLYSQTDTNGEYDTFGVRPMGPIFGAIFVPTNDTVVTGIRARMRLHSTSGGVSFLFYSDQSGSKLLLEQDFAANDPLFAQAQGRFADITVPVSPSTYLYGGTGVYVRLGSFQGHEVDYQGSISGGAFYPCMAVMCNQGGNASTAFSFGNSIHGGQADFDDHHEYNASAGTISVSSPALQSLNMTTNVGSYPPNPFGIYDMQGNVSEWCQDWYGAYPAGTAVDPHGPTNGTLKVVRGGSWADAGVLCRSAARSAADPGTASSHIGFRIVLAPLTPDWKMAVEKQPSIKTYGIPPTREPGKDGLVLITHGWSLLFPDQSWIDDMSNSIAAYLDGAGVQDWQVYGYHWEQNSGTLTADGALVSAAQEGIRLGRTIIKQGWTKVHFIAHSAGAELIQSAMETIRSQSPDPDIVIQCTFLDPFVGFDFAGQTTYGNGADWSDMYSSHNDIDVLGGRFTDVPLYSAYNVDVTALDPSLGNSDLFTGLGGYAVCHLFEASHDWSRSFYQNSITGDIAPGYDGFGFLLSDETGGWPDALVHYPVGNVDSVKILGTAPQSCSLLGALAATIGVPVDFTAVPVALKSDTGTIQTSAGKLTLITGSTAWISIIPTNAGPADLLTFSADYESGGLGAIGLLTAYMDTNVIGSIDERMVGEGAAQYTLSFPTTSSGGTHVLSFRLDGFSGASSTVIVTNVVLSQRGVSQPFSLSVIGKTTDGSPILELIGQAGFDYGLQASTNLADWKQIGILEDTTGTVSFADPEATNHSQRFYRAVAPY